MKFLILFLSFFSLSAFANFNEVECEGDSQNKEIFLEIEQSFPSGTMFRDANLSIFENGVETRKRYTVSSRITRGFPTIVYTGAGFRLEVDLWPDQTPRWGREYRGSLYSSSLSREVSNMKCSYPNAF